MALGTVGDHNHTSTLRRWQERLQRLGSMHRRNLRLVIQQLQAELVSRQGRPILSCPFQLPEPPVPKIDYFSSDSIREGLKGKTVRGGVALGAAQGCVILAQLVSIPILSRLLGPEDFGVIAIATLFTGFGHLLIDSGFATATIQRDRVTPQQASNIFWIAAGTGMLLTLALIVLATPISWLYGRNDVAPVIATLSSTFVLTALAIQHEALLRRAMRFSTLSIIRVGVTLASVTVSISLAASWGNYWALVAGQLTQALLGLVAVWVACGWRPGWPQRGVGTRSMVEFGASLTAARFINYVTRLADQGIVGAYLGADALGYYERAFKSLLNPIQSLNGPLVSLLAPAMSRVATQPEAYCRAFFTAAKGIAAIGFPLVALAAIDAERLVPLVLGPKWVPATAIFVALIPAAFVGVLKSIPGWVYVSLGRGIDHLKWHCLAGAVTLAGVLSGAYWGAVGIAWGFSLARVVVFPIGVGMAFSKSPLKASRLIRALWPVVVSTVATLVCMGVARSVASPWLVAQSFPSAAAHAILMASVYLVFSTMLGVPRSLIDSFRRVPVGPTNDATGPSDPPAV